MKLPERIFKRNDYYITSPFGTRINPITGENGEYHNGVDYGTNLQKWKQYALENGKVISCGKDSAKYGYANFVWVQYDRLGIKLLHYHLDTINVVKGQIVNENTVLGTTGESGNATGIHLHLGMKYLKDNVYVDAEQYDYKPQVEIVPTKRNEKKHQVEITIPNLNARNNPNGTILTFVPMGIYDILDEQFINNMRWAEINKGVWCALLEDCFIEYQVGTDYKKLYEEAQSKLNKIKEIVG